MTDRYAKYDGIPEGPWAVELRGERGTFHVREAAAKEAAASDCDGVDGHTVSSAVSVLIAAAPDLLAENRELLDLLTLALPYIEEAEWDKTLKPGAVENLAKRIRAAVEDRS